MPCLVGKNIIIAWQYLPKRHKCSPGSSYLLTLIVINAQSLQMRKLRPKDVADEEHSQDKNQGSLLHVLLTRGSRKPIHLSESEALKATDSLIKKSTFAGSLESIN